MITNVDKKFDMLFILFTQGGPNDGTMTQRIVRDIKVDEIADVIEELKDPANFDDDPGEGNFDIQGAVELDRAQTHFRDTNIIAPRQYYVCQGEYVSWLHDVKVFKRPNEPIQAMEEEANTSLEDQLEVERAEGEGMYRDEEHS